MATIANDTQFIGISPTIDLTGKKSAILNEQTIPVTMEDITSTVRPYKVFSALLTQSGSDNPQEKNDGDELQVGITYYIDVNEGYDFTPYGALNNNVGTYFICNQNVLTTTGIFFNLLYNTGAPVATVLENTIGNVWFTFGNVGSYGINSNGLFIENKFWVTTVIVLGVGGGAYRGSMYFNTQNIVNINTEIDVDTASNDLLYNTPIEIRVYE